MSQDDFELVRGSGNVFRRWDIPMPTQSSYGHPCCRDFHVLDEQGLSVRKAESDGHCRGGFFRIRQAKLSRLPLTDLMTI